MKSRKPYLVILLAQDVEPKQVEQVERQTQKIEVQGVSHDFGAGKMLEMVIVFGFIKEILDDKNERV